jgi:hypothetical protein
MSLVPLASLGEMLGVRVRGMKSIIRLACIIRNKDYWAIGRTVERLGIAHLKPQELWSMSEGKPVSKNTKKAATWFYVPAS